MLIMPSAPFSTFFQKIKLNAKYSTHLKPCYAYKGMFHPPRLLKALFSPTNYIFWNRVGTPSRGRPVGDA